SLGSTPKDILAVRGTMNLYHYRPVADEIYRVPILIVMATTNRGYILDMVPGQSFIEFLLKRGYDVYMLDWTAPKPEEKSLRMEDYVLDFIPDCVRRVQRDSGESDVSVIGYCFGGVLSLLYASIFPDGPMKNLIWDNKLYNDTMSVGGRKADISKITVPILHAVAEHDHIVPYDAAKPLIQKIGSVDKEEVMLKGGHVSLVAGANAIKRLWPKLDSW